ncbi:hypothetical protein TPHA_0O00980 [Tetrapisispora phaffii CBS 4417]|uniref:DNA polymerase n=1 Tax=Tetrapisispora phaffii (strain ATCC 24235 / CBS 4417 / NBRC 1672 / NRRL Y-8282 / UCD 70-5) TaxID=1071381 RepID=G8C1N9_TETPH|nr:hypothetical protein TPHA_0O00980 [Tetrapisispora phaffii CBS 4417]CCE66067.1 hypothetical protein TPHA_0O00980 [Tetrapisispora phaffii CBS 4417]
MLFYNKKFLILPNAESSHMQFIIKLIKKNGGAIVKWAPDVMKVIDRSSIVLINDSYVDSNNKLKQYDIFKRELRPWLVTDWEKVVDYRLNCVNIKKIHTWLDNGNFKITSNDLIETISVENSGKRVLDSQNELELSSNKRLKQNEMIIDNNDNPIENKSNSGESTNPKRTEIKSVTSDTNDIRDNKFLADALQILSKRCGLKGEKFRARSYQLAADSILKAQFAIKSGHQAQKNMMHIGPSISRKIDILLKEGTLPGLSVKSEKDDNIAYFMGCHNIGIGLAKKWELLKIKTFKEALEKQPTDFQTTWPTLFGISYYEDWSRPIMREECEEHLKTVQDELRLIDKDCKVELQGSYRRGAKTCGDIDLLFYKEGCDDIAQLGKVIEDLAISLYERNYVQCFLLSSSKIANIFDDKINERYKVAGIERKYRKSNETIKKLFLGVKLPNRNTDSLKLDPKMKLKDDDLFLSLNSKAGESVCRRMDFFLSRWSELGACRIQYTGSTDYNRKMKIIAMNKSMKISPHGLFKDDVLLESFDERKIFDILNIKYVEPEQRVNTVTLLPDKIK